MSDTRAADEWWESLPPERRNKIHGWLDGKTSHPEVDGQYEIPIHDIEQETTWRRSSSERTTSEPP